MFFAARGTFSTDSPFSCPFFFLLRIHRAASIIAASATRTIGTAIAACVPAESPPLDSLIAVALFAALDDVEVSVPDAEAAEVPEGLADVGSDIDEDATGMLEEGVEAALADEILAEDESCVVEVVNVVGCALFSEILDINDAPSLGSIVPVSLLLKLSLIVLKMLARVAVSTSAVGVNGSKFEENTAAREEAMVNKCVTER